MSELVLLIAGAVSALSIVLIIITVVRGWGSSKAEGGTEAAAPRREPVPVNRDGGNAMRRAQRTRHTVRNRMGAAATSRDDLDDLNEDDEDTIADQIVMPDGKVGVKKLKKLENKAEKRAARERELEEREERKQRQQLLDDQRKKEDEETKLEEAKKAEEERLEKEEQEKREHEEYLKMKEAFSVDQEGYEEVLDETQMQNRFQDFINYIQDQKVVLLEELAAQFKLKTQDCIDRVQSLIEQEQLVGVLDDRGKFISITRAELESVAKFIRKRGRLPISELVEASNQLINLTPPTAVASTVA